MERFSFVFLASLFLAACAGNPPAWWNPRGTLTPAATTQTATPREPVELDLSLPDDAYEEMTLTPLQDEEGEDLSGEASAQSAPSIEHDILPPPSVLFP